MSIVIAAVFTVADTFNNIGEKMIFASTMLTITLIYGPITAQFIMMIIVNIMSKMLEEEEGP
ncbi:MAG: hypothetical protein QXQ43_04530 [Nitrososphaerota archaeon]